MSVLPSEELICDECKETITWGEYNYSMNHFKRCMKSGNGLCVKHQETQRLIEYPKKLAEFLNNNL